MSWLYPDALPISMSLTAYNAFLTGLIVFFKRKDKSGAHYFICSFVIFLWGMGISFMLNNRIPNEVAQSWGTFSQAAALFIPATWLHFVLTYTSLLDKNKKWLWLTYLISLLILPFVLGRSFVAGYQMKVSVNNYPIPGPAYNLFALFFAVTVVFSFWIFIKAIRTTLSSDKRHDYRFIAWASLYGFGMGSLSFLPVYGIALPQWNLIFMPLWQIALTYIMIQHQAFDVEKMVLAAHRDKLAAIGTLATSINHEIRNPLYVIRGIAETQLSNIQENIYATKEAALTKFNDAFQKTEQQATRAMDIMKRFAVFAKQNTRVMPEASNINLKELLNNVLPLISHELELDRIDLLIKIPSDLIIKVDERHLEEILFNLIVNACQALKTIGGEIRVEAESKEEKILIAVHDNGPGIPETLQRHIFEPFHTTKDEGTGLGLYVVKQLIERNGGKISVRSKPGQGTTFVLEFRQ